MIDFKDKFSTAALQIYSNDTLAEWLEVYFLPHFDPIYEMYTKVNLYFNTNDWQARPQNIVIKKYN